MFLRCGRGIFPAVPDAPDGGDPLRVRGAFLDLLADAPHVDRDGGGVAVACSPYVLEKILAPKRLARMAHEEGQQLEFSSGQGDAGTGERDLPCEHVDPQVAVDEHGRAARRRRRERALRTAQDSAYARDQLPGREGFRNVVVGSQFEPDDPIGLFTAGGEHDHRHRCEGPEPPTHLKAVDSRKHEVEHDEIGRIGQGSVERCLTVTGHLDGEALALEISGHDLGDGLIVVDDENASGVHGFDGTGTRGTQGTHRHYETRNRPRFGPRTRPCQRKQAVMQLLIMAKEPVAGRVKTRLCPPCDPVDAAAIAEAALRDTLEHALASQAERVVLALDGTPGRWCPSGVEVIDQGAGDFATRLARAWGHMPRPTLQIGMDTPQLEARDLDTAMSALAKPGVDAVLGPALDGGWWGLGLRGRPTETDEVFADIAMSRHDTGDRQLDRLRMLGLHVEILPTHRDADTWGDACAIARAAPSCRFSEAVREVEAGLR